ncbi:MAG: double-strand break repair protein AddB, partial [Caulobacterales bacterium]
MSFLSAPSPRWFNIAAGRPFLEDLARGLGEALSPMGPDALSTAIVLTPTRRAGRDLAEAFLAVSGAGAVLLPQVRALGDLDEGEPPFEPGDLVLDLAPAISPVRRRFELARLVADHESTLGRTLDAGAALALGDALAAFLDSAQIEEVAPLDKLDDLAPGDLAHHWQVSAQFLRLALSEWPRRLERMGLADVAERRVA